MVMGGVTVCTVITMVIRCLGMILIVDLQPRLHLPLPLPLLQLQSNPLPQQGVCTMESFTLREKSVGGNLAIGVVD